MRSVVDRNVVMRHMIVLGVKTAKQNSTELFRMQECLIKLYSNDYINSKQTPNEAEIAVPSRNLHTFHTHFATLNHVTA